MPTTTLFLVRHGATDDDAPDPSLTPNGREQAAAAGHTLRNVTTDLVLHGSRRRAAETAQLVVAAVAGASASFSDLVEDRTPIPENWADVPNRYHGDLRAVPDDEADRGARQLTHAVQQLSQIGDDDRTIIAVTHNFVIGWFVRSALDAPWWRWIGLNQANGAITTIRWSHDREPQLLSFNERGHLSGT